MHFPLEEDEAMAGLPLRTIEAMIQLAEVDEQCPYLRDRTATLRFGSGLVAGRKTLP